MPETEASYDILVIGGGVAGVVAAISAARLGCSVALIQDRPTLGGNSSNEVRVWVTGGEANGNNRWARESGILEEIRCECLHRNCLPHGNGAPRPMWDWILWEFVTREPNISLYLNTRAHKAVKDSPDHIAAIIALQSSTENTVRFNAKLFIDCSGDGEIAADAGADFRMGRESRHEYGEYRAPEEADDKILCPSLLFSAHDEGKPVSFVRPTWAREFPDDESLEPMRDHGNFRAGYAWIEYGGTLDPIKDAERIRDELLRIVFGVWDHIKNCGDHGADNYALDWVGTVLGKRESRRFLGDHVLTLSDIEEQVLFPDRVAYGGWPLDHLHPPEGIDSKDPPGVYVQQQYIVRKTGRWHPYGTMFRSLYKNPPAHWPDILLPLKGLFSIPLRSLYSRNIENLLFAGRNASCSHVAFGSTRVQGTTAVMGQAVGTAAALCIKHGVTPQELGETYIAELQQQLLKDDCYIIGVRSEDPNDLARSAIATASSTANLEVTDFDSWLPLDFGRGQMISFSNPRVDAISLLMKSDLLQETRLEAVLFRGNALDDFYTCGEVARATAHVPGNSEDWIEFRFNTEIDPTWPHWIWFEAAPGLSWAAAKTNVMGTHRVEWFELFGRRHKTPGTHCFRCSPESRPFGPENVTNGVSRPEVGPNIWISDPTQPLPQWLELTFREPTRIDTIYLTFDTNLDRLYHSGGTPPDCVRDYRVLVGDGSGYVEVVHETDNYLRRRIHRFEPVEASAVKLIVEATNGSPEARIYEIRVYFEIEDS